jgi:hypothetical protein
MPGAHQREEMGSSWEVPRTEVVVLIECAVTAEVATLPVIQASERTGGARLACEEEIAVIGERAPEGMTSPFTACAKIAVREGRKLTQ